MISRRSQFQSWRTL